MLTVCLLIPRRRHYKTSRVNRLKELHPVHGSLLSDRSGIDGPVWLSCIWRSKPQKEKAQSAYQGGVFADIRRWKHLNFWKKNASTNRPDKNYGLTSFRNWMSSILLDHLTLTNLFGLVKRNLKHRLIPFCAGGVLNRSQEGSGGVGVWIYHNQSKPKTSSVKVFIDFPECRPKSRGSVSGLEVLQREQMP